MTLKAVRDPFNQQGEPEEKPRPASEVPREFVGIPDFEGQVVQATKAKITSVTGLEIDDRALRMDDTVTLLVQCRVVGVQHQVHEASGELHRVHTLKAIDSQILNEDFDTLKSGLM